MDSYTWIADGSEHTFRGDNPAVKELLRLSSQVQSLEAWKQEAIAVEKQWDVQKIGELIGATPGQHIRPLIQPFIESLNLEVERLGKELNWCRDHMLVVQHEIKFGRDHGGELERNCEAIREYLTKVGWLSRIALQGSVGETVCEKCGGTKEVRDGGREQWEGMKPCPKCQGTGKRQGDSQ